MAQTDLEVAVCTWGAFGTARRHVDREVEAGPGCHGNRNRAGGQAVRGGADVVSTARTNHSTVTAQAPHSHGTATAQPQPQHSHSTVTAQSRHNQNRVGQAVQEAERRQPGWRCRSSHHMQHYTPLPPSGIDRVHATRVDAWCSDGTRAVRGWYHGGTMVAGG